MILLDTHALIWWTLSPSELSKKARAACSEIEKNSGYISSISIWEIGIKIMNKKLDIGMPVSDYLEKLKMMNLLNIIPVDEKIWVESLMLDWVNRDPADRVIVATAKINNLSILSKDSKISQFYRKTIW